MRVVCDPAGSQSDSHFSLCCLKVYLFLLLVDYLQSGESDRTRIQLVTEILHNRGGRLLS